MARITESELLFVSKATQEVLKGLSQGVELSKRSGKSIKQLQVRVARDRLRLARSHLNAARAAADSHPPQHRTTVSRAYYAMYHAARAATYLAVGGDDHEQHSVLHGKLPADFPACNDWKNKIKDARLERNRADYDPYPQDEVAFSSAAKRLVQEAAAFVRTAKAYMKTKS